LAVSGGELRQGRLNRKNWVIIGLLVLGWAVFLNQPTGLSARLRMVFVELLTPLVKLGEHIPVVQSRRQLARENRQLRADNEQLRQQLHALSEIGRENLRLRALLEFKSHANPRSLGARVIGRDASNWWKSLQIDRGSHDGVRENMAVVSANGLVGKTVSVTRGEARVLLVLDPNCKVSALLEDSRHHGVVAGAASVLVRTPRCVMTYVERDAQIRRGETVITSGLGGVFPKGIAIGTVLRARLNEQTGMYQDVEIKPAADFHRLEEVLVILE
jgi:rod shape-determining protein MreC